MKKMTLVLMSFLLISCSVSANQAETMEQDPTLHIVLPDASYGKALTRLWDETYPEQKGALHIEVKTEGFHQQFASDIAWVSDCDAIYKKAYAQEFELLDTYPIPQHQLRTKLEGYFQPVEGKGYLYSYVASRLSNYDIQEDQMNDVANYQKRGMIFYDHSTNIVLPLWLAGYTHTYVDKDHVFLDEEFLNCIENMKMFYKVHQLEDDPGLHNDIYRNYLSGLVFSKGISSHPLYQSQQLHFISMPQEKDEFYAPIVDIYGFMVSKDCVYPRSAQAFLELVRSRAGIQAFLDSTDGIAIIQAEDLSDFSIYDSLRKEMICAMNDSVLWDVSTIAEKPSVRYKDLYEKTDMVSILQNGIVAGKTAEQIQKEIHAHVEEWIRKQ